MAHSHPLRGGRQCEAERSRCAGNRDRLERHTNFCILFGDVFIPSRRRAPDTPIKLTSFPKAAPMNWDDVRIFLAVARAGQILGAARRLGLNHATVSRRVAALEDALKARLFRRLTTGSELTPAGERFLLVAERMEADMIAARAEI